MMEMRLFTSKYLCIIIVFAVFLLSGCASDQIIGKATVDVNQEICVGNCLEKCSSQEDCMKKCLLEECRLERSEGGLASVTSSTAYVE